MLFLDVSLYFFHNFAQLPKRLSIPDLAHSLKQVLTNHVLLQGEESNSSANKCMLKVAQYCAQLENYERAIQIYEQVQSF